MTGSLECSSCNDALMLLKSSDRIVHALSCVSECDDFCNDVAFKHVLHLRKHYKLDPAMEFRCFIRDKAIVGRGLY